MSIDFLYNYIKHINNKIIPRQEYNIFMKNLNKIHKRTKIILKLFDKYTKYLKNIYDFLLLNKDYIPIKIDPENIDLYEIYYKQINNGLSKLSTNKYSLIDFGGAPRIFLNNLCNKINTSSCYVIKPKSAQSKYVNIIDADEFIGYIYWDDITFDIPDNSIDCCCAIMTLHNLTDEILDIVLSELYRILKKDGIIFLVEFDIDKFNKVDIDANHHMNYILQDQIRLIKEKKLINIKDCLADFKNYLDKYYMNYKSNDKWNDLFKKHKFNIYSQSKFRSTYYNSYYCMYNK